jgi:hypothetical protein
MLDFRFKSLLISSYVGHEKGVTIFEKYNKRFLYPMFIKCHNHLHHVLEYEVGCANIMVVVWIFLNKLLAPVI